MKTITNLVAGSDDDDSKQITSSDAIQQPPTTAKPGKESLIDSAKTHPLYLYINDSTSTILSPAHRLLNSLANIMGLYSFTIILC